MSMADSGSVHSTTSRSPLARRVSALRVLSAGRGQRSPRRLSTVSLMSTRWRTDSSTFLLHDEFVAFHRRIAYASAPENSERFLDGRVSASPGEKTDGSR